MEIFTGGSWVAEHSLRTLTGLKSDIVLPTLNFLLQVLEKIYFNPSIPKFRVLKTTSEVCLNNKEDQA